MWSSLSSRINRRRLLLALTCWPLFIASASATQNLPPDLTAWGSGEFRRFGFLIYEARLWAGSEDPVQPPLALQLTYKRNIDGNDIADASVKEMQKLGIADESQLKLWGEQMQAIFPDVRPGDRILGLALPEGARFYHNDRFAGGIDDPSFARALFAIWLDRRTSAPGLRAALLQRPGKRQ